MSDQLDPNKYHVLSPESKKKLSIIIGLLLLVIIPIFSYKYYQFAINRPNQTDKELTFEVKKGQGTIEVSRNLYAIGAINSEFLFDLYVYMHRSESIIQAGTYKISAGTNLVNLIKLFQHGKNDQTVTFLEGWRTEEYIKALTPGFSNIDPEKFFALAKPDEGYLFPDTYFFSKDAQEEDVVTALKTTFDTKTADILTAENLKRAGLTKSEVVILASIVEREVRTNEDKAIVAGILIKRWREGMKLDVDATTQYAAASRTICNILDASYANSNVCIPTTQEISNTVWWSTDLSAADLNIDSPYNTRKNVGLPPTPISNPGLGSIEAVVKYVQTPYYYYLTDSEGKTHYAKTLDEHNQNVATYLTN